MHDRVGVRARGVGRSVWIAAICVVWLLGCGVGQAITQGQALGMDGVVLDSMSGRPVSGAVVYHDNAVAYTGEDGRFEWPACDVDKPVLVKAPGFRQLRVHARAGGGMQIELKPFDAKGLYLTYYGVSSKVLRDGVVRMIGSTQLNAVVIDVKGDLGYLTFPCEVALAEQIGSSGKPTIKDMKALIDQLHKDGIYVIGRIVVFKDNVLAKARPRLATIDTRTGKPWIDDEKLAWVDPFQRQAWDYNIQIAIAAAKIGFDEIQFDYVRFPTDGKISAIRVSKENTRANRVSAITEFLGAAYQALLPYNVYVAADLFGYVALNENDTGIGQDIEEVAKCVDYICLMVYPSGYHRGVPGYPNPVTHPKEIVAYTLDKAAQRIGRSDQLRPWLQNFKDYAFDKRQFTETQILAQIGACQQAKTSGWLLWDASNQYKYTQSAMDRLARPSPSKVAQASVGK